MPKLHSPEMHTLSNGIPVIFQHYDGTAAATYWWIRTGSSDENPKEAGFAHFLEHMLFKDAAAKETGRESTGQLAQAIESLGGDINAYTSFDQTVYHVTCADRHWERVIEAFGGMAQPQRFLKADFEREREVILEELRKNEDSPSRQLFQSLFTSTFGKHPYGRPVIGFVKTLKAARVADLEAFYKRQYISSKMGLILVGPLEDPKRKSRILQLLEKKYGKRVISEKQTPPKVLLNAARLRRPQNTLKAQPSFKSLRFDVKSPTVVVGFRVPELGHPDVPALDLLAGILATGEMSRLYQRLFYEKALVSEVSGGLYIPKDPGLIYFQAEMENLEGLESVVRELFETLERIKTEGPTPEELSRMIVSAESEKLYATQTADGLAGRIGFMQYIVGDLGFDQKYVDELKSVDAQRVQEVAQKYLVFEKMTGVLQLPLASAVDPAPQVRNLAEKILGVPPQKSGSKVGSEGIRSKSLKSSSPRDAVERWTLPSGMRVVFSHRPQSHVFAIHGAAMGGLRHEIAQPLHSADQDWGVSSLISLTWDKGTPLKNAREISSLVEGRAAGLDGFSGRNSLGLQMTGLSRDWRDLSALYAELLMQPTFPDDEILHSKRVAEDSIRSIEDHSSQLCVQLFLKTLFEKHPYGRLTHGSLESISGMTRAHLAAVHQNWIRPERLVLGLSGPISRGQIDEFLSHVENQARLGGRHIQSTAPDLKVPDESPLRAPRWVEKNVSREQTHILVGGLGVSIDSEERFALRLLQTLLGGQSGKLFIELREKKSLAYTVSPVAFEGVERGYVGTYIACSPGKKDEAIAGIRKVLEDLAKKGPSRGEMTRAQEFYLGRRALDLQGDSAIASHFGLEALYRLKSFSDEEMTAKIRSITPRQIQEICKKYYVDAHSVTAIVG